MDAFDSVPLGKMALEKAQELFKVCDKEAKGFIIKRDMQRLSNELPGLSPDQLEEVFDSLDQDKNGFLTMEEFVHGFGTFLGLQIEEDEPPVSNLADEMSQAKHNDNSDEEKTVDEEQFNALMDQIGANEVLPEHDVTKKLWLKLRNDEPELLNHFEDFLHSISTQLKHSQDEVNALENALENRSSAHDGEIRKLYDEMEAQIRVEKERVSTEEQGRMQKLKDELTRELNLKDQQLHEFTMKHQDMEKRLEQVTSVRSLTELEKSKLSKEREEYETAKDRMESELESTRKILDEQKQQLEVVKKQTREERRERAKAAFRVTEGIATEREDLVKQLDLLRQVNKKLQDERDEMKTLPQSSDSFQQKRASVIGNYLISENNNEENGSKNFQSTFPHPLQPIVDNGYEMDEEELMPKALVDHNAIVARPFRVQNSLMSELDQATASDGLLQTAERVEPLGGNEKAEHFNKHRKESNFTPERIFKVVLVGDSGVGKTCFLHRFCHNRFKSTFSATIGVDFQVKSITVDDRIVALQLWDTAGQERFRSITKQYFRKADGVLLMYDVTSELSFLNLRNWMQSVKVYHISDGVEQDCVLCLVCNKVDLCDNNDDYRVVKHKDGQKLADEFGALFFETSAQTGESIQECMTSMSILLRDREDQHLEKALQLQMEVQKKRKCCGRR